VHLPFCAERCTYCGWLYLVLKDRQQQVYFIFSLMKHWDKHSEFASYFLFWNIQNLLFSFSQEILRNFILKICYLIESFALSVATIIWKTKIFLNII
jgi:hypothetical protein